MNSVIEAAMLLKIEMQRAEIGDLLGENKKLKKGLEEIANGHLQEKVSESIARQVLKELK